MHLCQPQPVPRHKKNGDVAGIFGQSVGHGNAPRHNVSNNCSYVSSDKTVEQVRNANENNNLMLL